MNYYSIIIMVGITQGVFLALALLIYQGEKIVAQRILAAIIIVFSFDLAGEFLYQTDYYYEFPWLIWVEDPIEFLYGPLLLFYISALTEAEKFTLNFSKWPHFIVFFSAIIFSIPFFTLDAVSKIQLVYQGELNQNSLHNVLAYFGQLFLVFLFIIQTGFYLIIVSKKLITHTQKIHASFSYTERINFAWLRNIVICFCILYLLFVIDFFANEIFGFDQIIKQILYLLIVVMFYIMAFLGLHQPAIFSSIQSDTRDSNIRYSSSALNTEMSLLLLEELKRYMENERPFLENKLTLPQLALKIKISTNYLSQIINEQLGMNFFDFINGYRIEEAKKSLSKKGKINILNIALDSGFNSKSAFYMAFKKKTQMTPSQYKKTILGD